MTVQEECDLVASLKANGATHVQIAEQLGKSVYWVHTRLNPKYTPLKQRGDKIAPEISELPQVTRENHEVVFQDIVRAKLIQDGYAIENAITSGVGFSQNADIIATKSGETFIIEVKKDIKGQSLQTAIGQLILHNINFSGKYKLVIAIPRETSRELSDHIVATLYSRYNIIVYRV